MKPPKLTFFCELEAEPLERLFSDPKVVNYLKTLNAQVSLGLLDLSERRAESVRRLNAEQIPVTAWLLLPKEQGYWFNLDNASHSASRYAAFKDWSAEHGLQWAGIGLDIEPDIQLIQQLLRDRLTGLKRLVKKALDGQRLQKATREYRALVAQIRHDGYLVESYQFPLILDERDAGSTILQRVGGLVDLEVDREVFMLYTSFLRPHGAAVLWEYARHADGVGIGNTGGGVEIAGVQQPDYLSWQEFERDLRLACQHTEHLYIFSLEGCVNQGFLPGLVDFDWHQRAPIPTDQLSRVRRFRRLAHVVLWTASRPWIILIAVAFFWLCRRLSLRKQLN